MADIAILGSGGWGMALAVSAHLSGNNVTLWSPFDEEVKMLTEKRCNEKLLSGIVLPDGIKITSDISCVSGSALTILATPSTVIRSVAAQLAEQKDFGIVVNVSKGLEKGSLLRLSQVIGEEIPGAKIAVLSGPSHAEEVARNIPTSLVAASKSLVTAQIVQNIMSGDNLRVYTSDDLVGVELGGALKNVIAIAAGFCRRLRPWGQHKGGAYYKRSCRNVAPRRLYGRKGIYLCRAYGYRRSCGYLHLKAQQKQPLRA